MAANVSSPPASTQRSQVAVSDSVSSSAPPYLASVETFLRSVAGPISTYLDHESSIRCYEKLLNGERRSSFHGLEVRSCETIADVRKKLFTELSTLRASKADKMREIVRDLKSQQRQAIIDLGDIRQIVLQFTLGFVTRAELDGLLQEKLLPFQDSVSRTMHTAHAQLTTRMEDHITKRIDMAIANVMANFVSNEALSETKRALVTIDEFKATAERNSQIHASLFSRSRSTVTADEMMKALEERTRSFVSESTIEAVVNKLVEERTQQLVTATQLMERRVTAMEKEVRERTLNLNEQLATMNRLTEDRNLDFVTADQLSERLGVEKKIVEERMLTLATADQLKEQLTAMNMQAEERTSGFVTADQLTEQLTEALDEKTRDFVTRSHYGNEISQLAEAVKSNVAVSMEEARTRMTEHVESTVSAHLHQVIEEKTREFVSLSTMAAAVDRMEQKTANAVTMDQLERLLDERTSDFLTTSKHRDQVVKPLDAFRSRLEVALDKVNARIDDEVSALVQKTLLHEVPNLVHKTLGHQVETQVGLALENVRHFVRKCIDENPTSSAENVSRIILERPQFHERVRVAVRQAVDAALQVK
ncbi:hypothetical protein HDU93_000719 [Gonapodya sp. JEL0774]|nr:hypothetical protein HDU93_000719 [Gonapodya sp. JEL0774]